MTECSHGYPEAWRRHCVDCRHSDEVNELNADIKRLQSELERIQTATMSMFASKDDMIRYMKRVAREALGDAT